MKVNETTGACDLSMDPSNPRIMFAAMWDHQRMPWLVRSGGRGGGLYRSADLGETWEKLTKESEFGTLSLRISENGELTDGRAGIRGNRRVRLG